jgi:hypothetical protein
MEGGGAMGLGINVVVSVSYIAGGGWATFCASQIFAFRVKSSLRLHGKANSVRQKQISAIIAAEV